MKRTALMFAVLSLFGVLALADEGHHHEDLTAEQLGTVHFPVSCTASSQKTFERGVALLHSFWYEEAEKEFVAIEKDDPACAMAHWGVAMSLWHQLWDKPNAATVKRGMTELKEAQSLRPATDRERDYIAALSSFYRKKGAHDERARAYSQAMEGVHQRYAGDREAAVFYALSLLASLSKFPALYALELHHWTEAAALTHAPGADSGDKAITYWARAIGSARAGNVAEARKDIAELESIRQEMLKNKKASWAQVVEDAQKEAGAWVAHAEGKDEEAVKALRAIAEGEESTGNEPEDIPAREMLADLLLEAKHPDQALAEYETDLKFNPNRFNGLYGAASAAEMAGKHEKASAYYAQLVKECDGSASDRPELGRAKALLASK
jgi:tetratricopeptide (TPR) repeat protein